MLDQQEAEALFPCRILVRAQRVDVLTSTVPIEESPSAESRSKTAASTHAAARFCKWGKILWLGEPSLSQGTGHSGPLILVLVLDETLCSCDSFPGDQTCARHFRHTTQSSFSHVVRVLS